MVNILQITGRAVVQTSLVQSKIWAHWTNRYINVRITGNAVSAYM